MKKIYPYIALVFAIFSTSVITYTVIMARKMAQDQKDVLIPAWYLGEDNFNLGIYNREIEECRSNGFYPKNLD